MFGAVAAAALALPLGGVGDYAVPRPPWTPAAAVSAAVAGRGYGGSTSDGSPIAIGVGGRQVTEVVLEVRAPCDSKQTFPVASVLARGRQDVPAISGGKLSRTGGFRARATGTADLGTQSAIIKMGLTGKLGARRSGGTVVVDVTVRDKASGQAVDHCAAATRWSERVPERRVLSGATAQSAPAVLELSPNRRSVKTFRFGIFAGCTPDGSIAPVDVITNFPIRNHRFGDSFSDEGPDGLGGTIHIDYSFRGRMGRAAASGTIAVTATERDAQGNTVATCPSGAVRWATRQ
jgi:hypothetical protein